MDDRKPSVSQLAERLEALEPLDAVAEPLAKTVRDILPGGPVKDALSGRGSGTRSIRCSSSCRWGHGRAP